MSDQICHQCKTQLRQGMMYCTHCGTKNSTAIKHKSTRSSIFNVILFALVIFFIGAIGSGVLDQYRYRGAQTVNNKQNESNDTLPTSNPAYLVNPAQFLVDAEMKISDEPEDGKSVWVESVLDGNSVKISYIILKGGENIITFRNINLFGIGSSTENCSEQQSVDFLRKFIEHKYVYLSTPGIGCDAVSPQFRLAAGSSKYISILKEDVDPTVVSVSGITGPSLDVGLTLVYNGYGQYNHPLCQRWSPGDVNDLYIKNLKNQQEVASVAKRGAWGACK